jgi:hypothetical protein
VYIYTHIYIYKHSTRQPAVKFDTQFSSLKVIGMWYICTEQYADCSLVELYRIYDIYIYKAHGNTEFSTVILILFEFTGFNFDSLLHFQIQ